MAVLAGSTGGLEVSAYLAGASDVFALLAGTKTREHVDRQLAAVLSLVEQEEAP